MIKIQHYVTGVAQSAWGFLILAVIFGAGIGLAITMSANPLIVTGVILAGLFVAMSLINVELGLLVLILMLYLRLSDIAVNVYGLPSLARPFIALLIAAAAVRWVLDGSLPRGWFRALFIVGFYGLVVFISLFFAADFSRATLSLDDFVKDGSIAILITMLVQRGTTFRRVVWALIIAGIFTGSISVYQYATGTFDNTYWGFAEAPKLNIIGETESNRVAGMLGSPNYYAQILVILVPLTISQFLDEHSIFLKLLAAWSAIVCSLSIFFTYSRGGTVALLITLFATAVYRKLRLTFLLLALLVSILVLRFVPNPFFERLQTIPDALTGKISYVDEVSFRGRASEFIVAVQMFMDHPFFGVGVDNYPINYQEYSRLVGLDPRSEQRQAHNLFLRTAAETGLAGLIAFGLVLWMMIKSVIDAYRKFKQTGMEKYANLVAAFGISILGFLSDSMFTHNAFARYFWILVGIALALPQVVKHTTVDYTKDSVSTANLNDGV